MESEFTLTTDDLWKNTIRSVEAAYCWLLTYEGKNYELVEESISSLRKLITHGKKYEDMKSFSSFNQPKTFSKNKFKKSQYYAPVSYDLEPNWQQLDGNTIEVDLGANGEKAIAIAVTTEAQLDMVIKDVYEAKCIAVDCEFMGVKKSLPELKLLQIGVSPYKGYAIQVDIIGAEIISKKLKPLLEDESLDIVGWAFRSDALAIESYINGIELAPVLDLQAKLLSIAVEQLNLGNAMNKFASEWIGNQEFQKAKLAGSQFSFTGNDCIWLISPLPPKALVYAVFDVLSVFALHEYTKKYTSKEEYYWPFAVIANSSQKAIDRWHVQRASGINSPSNPGTVNVIKPKKQIYSAGSTSALSQSSIVTKTDDGYDDSDIRYQRDLQVALERSVKECIPGSRPGGGEPSQDRVVDSSDVIGALAEELNSSSCYELKNDEQFSNVVQTSKAKAKSNTPEIKAGTWGTFMLDEQPFIGNNFANVTSPNTRPARTHQKKDFKSTTTYQWTGNNDTKLNQTWGDAVDKNLPTQWGDASIASSPSSQKQWGDTNIASSPSGNKQWGDTNVTNSSSNNKQWGDNNITSSPSNTKLWSGLDTKPSGSSGQWRDSNKTADHNSPKTLYRSPKISEPRMNITPSSSSSARPSPNKPPAKSPNLDKQERSPQPGYTSFKPEKTKYASELKNRIAVGNQGGSFTWAPDTKDQMSSASWNSFVSSSRSDWEKGKDITLDSIMNPVHQENQPSSEPIPFNTKVHDNYTRGGNIGDSSKGTMTNEHVDNWEVKEERPDTMQMPMNQIPIRTKFSGPRVSNPHDEENDDDDDDNDDDSSGSYNDADFPILKVNMDLQKKVEPKTKEREVDSLPTFVDGIYLYSDEGPSDLSMLRLTTPEHLDMVYMPPEGTDFTVAITYHYVPKNNNVNLKAIQVYVSTGESYTALVERTFMMKPPGALKDTKFGRLLTDPSIKRVCWWPGYIESEFEEKLGFTIGDCVDLAQKANYGRGSDTYSFIQAITEFLKDWQDMNTFVDARADFERVKAKNFSSTCWDKEKLSDTVLHYSALQGLAAFLLYQKTFDSIKIPDTYFMYKHQ